MALFSQIDWLILLAIGGFLLFGQGQGATLRQLGRWYGRLARLKQELLSEFTRAADLPTPSAGRPFTIRQALFESDPTGGRVSGIPIAVASPPMVAATATLASAAPVVGVETWSIARPSPGLEAVQ